MCNFGTAPPNQLLLGDLQFSSFRSSPETKSRHTVGRMDLFVFACRYYTRRTLRCQNALNVFAPHFI